MEKNNETLVLDLPNISKEVLLKLTEQIILQSEILMDTIMIKNESIIVSIHKKKD